MAVKAAGVHQVDCAGFAPAVTRPLGLPSCWKLQPRLTGSPTKRATVSVSVSRKPERGPLSCCSHGPPEGPQHPLIKYTSPPAAAPAGTPAGRTLLWEGDTGRTTRRESSWAGREAGGKMEGGEREAGREKEVQTLRSLLTSRESHLTVYWNWTVIVFTVIFCLLYER